MPPFDADSQTQSALQGLGTLSSALFPNPASMAQGYYYGALARKAQIEGYKDIDAMNANNNLSMGIANVGGQGPAPAPQSYSTVMLPGGTPLNIMNSPSNLPGVGAPAAPAAAPTAPPASAAAAVMPTPGQVAQAAANTPAAVAPAMYGQAPPGGASPAPGAGAPAAPTTTTSNGQTPTNQYGEGTIHPASVNPTPGQGGTLQAPPAGQNGSIAGTQFNLLNFVNLSQRAGRDAASSMAIGRAYLGQLLNQNQISEGEYRRQLASVGEPGPYTTTISDTGATTRQAMADATEIQRTKLVEGGAMDRLLAGVQPVVDPNNANQVTYPTLRQMQTGTFRGGNPQTANLGGAYGQYIDPKTGVTTVTTAQDASTRGLVPVAGSSDQLNAQTVQQIRMEPDPVKRQAAVDQLIATTLRGQTIPPDQQNKQKQDDYNDLQAAYPVPKQGWLQKGVQISAPVALDPDAAAAVAQRVNDLRRTPGPNQVAYLQDAGAVYRAAIKSLQDEGALSTPDQINQGRTALRSEFLTGGAIADARTSMSADLSKPHSPVTPHMTIHLVKPPATVGPGSPSLGATVTTPPAGATGGATPGANAAPTTGPAPAPQGPQYGSAASAATPNAPQGAVPATGPVAVPQTGAAAAPAAPATPAHAPYGTSPGYTAPPSGETPVFAPYGGSQAGAVSPSLGAVIGRGNATSPTPLTPLTPQQIYGGTGPAAGRPIAPAATPTQPAATFSRLPPGWVPSGTLIGPAPQGMQEGTGKVATGQPVINRGGQIYAQ